MSISCHELLQQVKKPRKLDLKVLGLYFLGAIAYSILAGFLNNLKAVSTDFGAVFIVGFLTCLVYFLLSVFMYKRIASLSPGHGFLGSLIFAPIIFLILNVLINLFQDIGFMTQPRYNIHLWIYALLMYFVANSISMFLMFYVNNKRESKKELIEKLTGRKK